MKKAFAMMMLAAGLLSCAKENLVPQDENTDSSAIPVSFNISVAETKASKTAWAEGDVIYVFFNGMGSKYLKLSYGSDGRWTETPGGEELYDTDFDGLPMNTLTAVHFPVAVDVSYADGKFLLTRGGAPVYNYYLYQEGKDYSLDLTTTPVTVTATLSLGKPADMVQIFVPGIQDEVADYTFGCSLIRPLACTGVHVAGRMMGDELQAGARLSGIAEGEGAIFAGRLTWAALEADYTFTLACDEYIYTLKRPAHKLFPYNRYIFPALSETGGDPKWTKTDVSDLYVDLGLPSGTKWAKCNAGAAAETDYGDYFAWGEIQPKSTYSGDASNYLWYDGSSFIKYTSGEYAVLQKEDDAAYAALGGKFRTPTYSDIDELVATQSKTEDYTWTWCDGISKQYQGSNVPGWKVTKKVGEATIFFPAAGYRDNARLTGAGLGGYYWSSSLHESFLGQTTRSVYFRSDYPVSHNMGPTLYGHSVRPVSD